MQKVEQAVAQSIYKHNIPGYAFVDTDIQIVLNALEQRDENNLNSDVIITAPVSQEDNTLTTQLNANILQNHSTILCPIKVTGRYHWQLVVISNDGESIVCGLYDTDGKVTQPDDYILQAIQNVMPKVESVDSKSCNWHQWEHSAQKGINCGLVVALMAHQLRLKTTTNQASQTNDYAGFDPRINDASLRNHVSDTVMQYGNDTDKMVFCTYKPSNPHKFSGISYDAKNADQQSVYQSCTKLTPDQLSQIATIICQHQNDDTRRPLREALSALPYAGFLFTTDDKNETCWKDEAENTLLYYYTAKSNKAYKTVNQDQMQIERSDEQRHDKNHENLTMTDQMQLYDAKNGIARSITQQDTCHNPANPPIISSTQLAELNAGLLNHYLEYSLATRAKIKKKLQGMISGDTPYLFSHQADAAVIAWVALSQGKSFLLGDQPGVGKTRTILATSMLYRLNHDQSNKTLIIVSNDAQVNVFKNDLESYRDCLCDQVDMAVDIKKVSEVQKMKDFSNYDLVTIDEVHSMIDSKSIKSEKDGKLNYLLSVIEDKDVLLASATAAKSLEELKSIMPILDDSRSKSKGKRQKESHTNTMIKSSLFVEQLQESGQMISRMLSDSKKLGDDIKAGKTDVCHIQNVKEHTSLTTELHTIYNEIINKIEALRTMCAQTQEKSYYDKDNASLLAYIKRTREDIIKYQLISEAVQKRQEDPGYHTMICVREYGCQEDRIQSILDGFRKNADEGSEQGIAVKELAAHIKAFQKKCDDFSEKNKIFFNPEQIIPEEKYAIVVCSRSHLTGLNLNDMLAAKGKKYRDSFNSEFKFQLSVVENLESWTTVWQGIHRVMRCNNEMHYGEGLTVKQINFASTLSRIGVKRETQKIIIDSLRLGSHESSHQSDLIKACKKKLASSMHSSLQKISELSEAKFLIEIDFLPIEQLQEVSRIVEETFDEIKKEYATKHHMPDFKLIHCNQNNQSVVGKTGNKILCNKSAILRYSEYFSILFDCEPKQFTVEGHDEIYFGWDASAIHSSDLTMLYDKAIYQYIDSQLGSIERDHFIEQLTAAHKNAQKSMSKKKGGDKKHNIDRKVRHKSNGKFGADMQSRSNQLSPMAEGSGNKAKPSRKSCELEDNDDDSTQKNVKRSKKKYRQKISGYKNMHHDLQAILAIGSNQNKEETQKSGNLDGSNGDTALPQKRAKKQKSTHKPLQTIVNESSQDQYKTDIIAALEQKGYAILLDRLSMGNYEYSIYHYFLEQEDWEFILRCETYRRPNQKSCLGLRSIGQIDAQTSYNGWSILHHAVFHQNTEAVEYLCCQDHGSLALLHCKTQDADDQSTALHMAMANYVKSYDASQKNQQAGMPCNNLDKETTIISALAGCQIPSCDFNIKDHNGKYPIELLNEEALNALLGSNISDTAREKIKQQQASTTVTVMSEETSDSDDSEATKGHHDSDKQEEHTGRNKKRSYAEMEKNHKDQHTQISRMLTKMIEEKKELDKTVQQFIEDLDSNHDLNITSFNRMIQALQIPDTDIVFRKKALRQLAYYCQSIMSSSTDIFWEYDDKQHVKSTLKKLIRSDLLNSSEQGILLDNCRYETMADVQTLQEIFHMSRPELQKTVLNTVDKYLKNKGYYHESDKLSPNTLYKNNDFSGKDSLAHLLILHRNIKLFQLLHYAGLDISMPNISNDTVWHSLLQQSHCGNIDPLIDNQTFDLWVEVLPNITHYIDEKNSFDESILDLWIDHSDDTIFTDFGTILIKHISEQSDHLTMSLKIFERALKRCKRSNIVIEGLQRMYESSQKYSLDSMKTETTFDPETESTEHLPDILNKADMSNQAEKVNSLDVFTIPSTIKTLTNEYVNSNIRNNERITHVVIPGSVTNIDSCAFYRCKNLESVVISEGIKSINQETFRYCTSLQSVVIPDSVTSIGYATFLCCTSLESVKISSSVKSISQCAFFACTSLESVEIPDSVQSINDWAFKGCRNLKSIVIPDKFCDAKNKKRLGIGESVNCIPYSEHIKKQDTESNVFTIPSTIKGVTDKYVNANIKNNERITHVVIPGSAYTISRNAFKGCTNLESVVIYEGVKWITGNAFKGCTNLRSIKIPKGVIGISSFAFSGCRSLQSVVIPEGIQHIGPHAFASCTKLQSVVITKGVEYFADKAFSGCTSLKSIVLPDQFCNAENKKRLGISASVNCIPYSEHAKWKITENSANTTPNLGDLAKEDDRLDSLSLFNVSSATNTTADESRPHL